MIKKSGLSICIVLLMTIFCISASPISAESKIDILSIGMRTGNAVSLDPAKAYEAASSIIVNQLYDKLVDFKVDDRLICRKMLLLLNSISGLTPSLRNDTSQHRG